jgi:hypothetical protein
MSAGGTLMVGSDTQTVDGCTLMSVGGTLTIGDDT